MSAAKGAPPAGCLVLGFTEVFDAADAEGHIGFQVHDVGDRSEPLTVRFRNARLRTLVPTR